MALIYSEKYYPNYTMSGNSNKRLRLDVSGSSDFGTLNEDLWDKDDITAEEFDMLELQATQALNQTSNGPINQDKNSDTKNILVKNDDSKQLQYELEGRVKLLSQSLEKSSKDLVEERLNRERIIAENMKEAHAKEENLLKEIEKMQSVLKFKEQEMKSVYSKLHILQSQTIHKKEKPMVTEMHSAFPDGFKKLKTDLESTKSSNYRRKHILPIEISLSESKSVDILSSVMYTRLSAFAKCSTNCLYSFNPDETSNPTNKLSAMSLVRAKNEQDSDEILEYYIHALKSHIECLKSLSSKSVTMQKDGHCSQFCVPYLLKDIQLLMTCERFSPVLGKNEDDPRIKHEAQSFCPRLKKCNSSLRENIVPELLNSLITLANPLTYPKEYCGFEEVELSLLLLLRFCDVSPQMLIDSFSMISVERLLKKSQSGNRTYILLKILSILSSFKEFIVHIVHKNNNCILCSMALFLLEVKDTSDESFSLHVLLIIDTISTVFSTHNCPGVVLHASECLTKIIQGLVVCLLQCSKYKSKTESLILILKKGLLLLHFMCNNVPDFKERRSTVEDKYIYLISSYVLMCNDDLHFKDFSDYLNNLWDLQTDANECDYEVSEDMETV